MGPLADFFPIEDDGFMSNRKLAIDVIQKLPEDATRHDIAREIEFVAGVRQEFEQIERGEGVPAEQVLRYDPLMACKKGGTVGWAAIEHQLEMDCGAIGDGDVDLCVQRAARGSRGFTGPEGVAVAFRCAPSSCQYRLRKAGCRWESSPLAGSQETLTPHDSV